MTEQPFARDQAKAFTTGPFLGGYVFVLTAGVAAGGSVNVDHPMRVLARHVEVVGQPLNEYPSRVTFSANTPARATVKFESAQSAGAALWLW
jgi:hypothetical protein